jgi:hypothetical protein
VPGVVPASERSAARPTSGIFGDVNPAVHAWAELRPSPSTAADDIDFLSGIFDKLLVNFTRWVNR